MMKTRRIFLRNLSIFTVMLLAFTSCDDFLNPKQDLNITEEDMFDDWYEYRSAEMGMYALQQNLVEQLFILGELRGDLVNITENATADMVEVYNFNISRENEYAKPTNLFKLIAATNNFISVLERDHPEVLDKDEPLSNYDRLYGEALTMRAWAYFNGVRIYKEMPYIPNSLESYDEIKNFVNSSGTYIDSVHITFHKDGYYNDTTIMEIPLEKQYYDLDMVVDHFTDELENNIKGIGVNHYFENSDVTWEQSIWNEWALHALLGQMYLSRGDLVQAVGHFEQIVNNPSEEYRYQIGTTFQDELWRNIFTDMDNREHIFTIWFNKANFQQNPLQEFCEKRSPHKYMIKPSHWAIDNWETEWRYQQISDIVNNPSESEMIFVGMPSDFYRGIGLEEVNPYYFAPADVSVKGSSYMYERNGLPITELEYFGMLYLRSQDDDRGSQAIMDGMDTLIYKYSIEKDVYDQDANYSIFRAAGIHLYMAEIYAYWRAVRSAGGEPITQTETAEDIINDGAYYTTESGREQLGVRGRVGLGSNYDIIDIRNIIYRHDPYTNEITGYTDYSGKFDEQKAWFEEQVMDERARELAFEGERFYDILRVANRRGGMEGMEFMAKTISRKYPSHMRDMMYNKLMDENNWYINYFDVDQPLEDDVEE